MTGIESILEQIRLFAVQHAPSEMLTDAVPFALICLVAGTGLSVLGAKLSRFGLTCGFVLLGGAAGAFAGRGLGFPVPVCGLGGALMGGVIGYQTFRLWVGLAAALVFSAVALGLFGYKQIVPHVPEFNQMVAVPAAGGSSFELPSPEQQQAYRDRTPRQWVEEFWSFVGQKDASVPREGRALALAALLTGLCLGVMAVRTALILSTSLLGTGLVATSLATFLTNSVPASCSAVQQHPIAIGIGVGAFFVASVVVQTLLTRKAPSGEAESAGKS